MDGLRGREVSLTWLIAWRFLRGHGSRLLSGTARAALLATALGVAAMVIAMALMTGYSEDLQAKLIGNNAAVGAYPLTAAGADLGPEVLARLTAIDGLEAVRRVAYGQGLLDAGDPSRALEVTIRGEEPAATTWARPEQLAPGTAGVPGAVLGTELARKLGAPPGAVLRLTALGFVAGRPRFHYQSLRLAGTFTTGFSEFDAAWVVVDRELLERLTGGEAGAILYEFRLADSRRAAAVAAEAEKVLGPDFLVTDWRNLNRDLFFALKLQKRALFLALGLIVLVSTFNVASTLVVLVRERMRDIGALAAMGLEPGRLRRIFLLYGGFLGTAGTLIGVGAGWGISWVLTTFHLIRFGPEVAAIYFIESVPFRVEIGDVGAIVACALALTLAACLLPAWRAARVNPSSALRYE
jgi:lipoprotein-releasing system permease protein